MRVPRSASILLAGVMIFALNATPAAAASPSGGARVAAVDTASARQLILTQTNAARAAAGLPALAADSRLDTVAQSCSQTQASRNAMAHCSGFQHSYPAGWQWAAENVATGYALPSVVAGWMGSAGHKANILNPRATHIGIGYAISASGRPYYTQNLATYPAGARSTGPQYYRTAYDGTIWRVLGTSIRALTWAEWQSAGFPAYRPAPTDYVKYPWSPSLSAVTFFGKDPSLWVWKPLTFAMWTSAGRPNPRAIGWLEGSKIHQWGTSDELFLTDPGGVVHKLSYPEWQATGRKGFSRHTNQGYVKLAWDGTGGIAFMCDLKAGKGNRIGFGTWVGSGAPTPRTVRRVAGDSVYWAGPSVPTGRPVNYAGPSLKGQLSYPQYLAMGAPAPGNAAKPTGTCG